MIKFSQLSSKTKSNSYHISNLYDFPKQRRRVFVLYRMTEPQRMKNFANQFLKQFFTSHSLRKQLKQTCLSCLSFFSYPNAFFVGDPFHNQYQCFRNFFKIRLFNANIFHDFDDSFANAHASVLNLIHKCTKNKKNQSNIRTH